MQSGSTLSSASFLFSITYVFAWNSRDQLAQTFSKCWALQRKCILDQTQKELSEKLIKKSKNLRKNSSSGNEANLQKMTGRDYCALTGTREYNENDHSLKYGTWYFLKFQVFWYLNLSAIFHDIISFYCIFNCIIKMHLQILKMKQNKLKTEQFWTSFYAKIFTI